MLLTGMRREGTPEVRRGDVCLIGEGPDFFVALADHPEWGNGHIVWGHVADMTVPDAIAKLPVKSETWGTTPVTPLVDPLPFSLTSPTQGSAGDRPTMPSHCSTAPSCLPG